MKRLLLLGVSLLSAACAPTDYCDGTSSVNRDGAMFAAHNLIKTRLKSPASAEGPSNSDGPDVSVWSSGQCEWTVTSYVDSQNGFGAMLRTKYRMVMDVDQSGTYRLKEVDIFD